MRLVDTRRRLSVETERGESGDTNCSGSSDRRAVRRVQRGEADGTQAHSRVCSVVAAGGGGSIVCLMCCVCVCECVRCGVCCC